MGKSNSFRCNKCNKKLSTTDDIDIYAVEHDNLCFCIYCGSKVVLGREYVICNCGRILPVEDINTQVRYGRVDFSCPKCEDILYVG